MALNRIIGRLRRDEGGFTLMELMASISIGLIVLFAAFMLVDSVSSASRKVDNRVDATQRGRQAMGELTQRLRARVCLEADDPTNAYADDSKTSLIYADANIALFYADLGDERFRPELFMFWYTGGSIHQFSWLPNGTEPNLTYDLNNWSRYRVVATNVVPPASGKIFRYYAGQLTPSTTDDPKNYTTDLEVAPAGTAVSASDLLRILRIDISFRINSVKGTPATAKDATFESTVTARGARPPSPPTTQDTDGDPGGPECLFS